MRYNLQFGTSVWYYDCERYSRTQRSNEEWNVGNGTCTYRYS